LAQNLAISKKKKSRVFLTQNQTNKVFSRAFFVPNMAQDKSLRESKSRPGGAKIYPGGAAAPPLPAPMVINQLPVLAYFIQRIDVLY